MGNPLAFVFPPDVLALVVPLHPPRMELDDRARVDGHTLHVAEGAQQPG